MHILFISVMTFMMSKSTKLCCQNETKHRLNLNSVEAKKCVKCVSEKNSILFSEVLIVAGTTNKQKCKNNQN